MRNVILSCTMLAALSACGTGLEPQSLPATINIEDSCTPEEELAIRHGADLWNRAGVAHLQDVKPMIIIGDRVQREFDGSVFHDGARIVFCAHKDTKAVSDSLDSVSSDARDGVVGFGNNSAVLLLGYRLLLEPFNPEEYLQNFELDAQHELGHFLGFDHIAITAGAAVMNPSLSLLSDATEQDIAQLCRLYQCK